MLRKAVNLKQCKDRLQYKCNHHQCHNKAALFAMPCLTIMVVHKVSTTIGYNDATSTKWDLSQFTDNVYFLICSISTVIFKYASTVIRSCTNQVSFLRWVETTVKMNSSFFSFCCWSWSLYVCKSSGYTIGSAYYLLWSFFFFMYAFC